MAAALRRGGRSPVDALADFILTIDPGAAGPARVFVPDPAPVGLEGAWIVAQAAIRDALFDGRIPAGATWAGADAVAGVAVTHAT